MQALQPRVKELQAKYAGDPERLQVRQRRAARCGSVLTRGGCFRREALLQAGGCGRRNGDRRPCHS